MNRTGPLAIRLGLACGSHRGSRRSGVCWSGSWRGAEGAFRSAVEVAVVVVAAGRMAVLEQEGRKGPEPSSAATMRYMQQKRIGRMGKANCTSLQIPLRAG